MKKMKKYILTAALSSLVLLMACGTEAPQQEEAKTGEVETAERQEEVQEVEQTKDDEQYNQLSDRQKDIASIIEDYELPEKGQTHLPDDVDNKHAIAYKNGVIINEKTKESLTQWHIDISDSMNIKTGQHLSVIISHFTDMNDKVAWEEIKQNERLLRRDIDKKLDYLYDVFRYVEEVEEYKPIKNMTIDMLDDLEEARVIRKTDLESAYNTYEKAVENIKAFNEAAAYSTS
ncbi:hypothetical protein D7Z54_16980 [Salibacterium salarium]|uniref:Lipoprotein n=1 Tax=Salibacterium salarium TaxID=284579 RepID=A0A3R9WRM0_9BACI|nr:hypothetical protein [Salibacterium salarium]RSL32122.1 hypothetical protein D7Z54_16980 [Salibacterium salarium]